MQRYILYKTPVISFREKLEKLKFKPAFIEKNVWKFHYVFSLAINNLARTNWESKFVRANIGALDLLFGGQGRIHGKQVRYSKFVLDSLIEWGVLIRQRTNVPSVGPHGEPIKLTRVDIKVNDNALVAGYTEWSAPQGFRTCELTEETPTFDHLVGIYRQIAENNQVIIEFNAAAAREFALIAYQDQMPLPAKRIDNVLYENRHVDKRVYTHWLNAIGKMESKLYNPKADNAVGKTDRYFSLISNLPRELRRFITIGGEQLAEVDISSSQCLIFAIYLKQHYAALAQELPADVVKYIELCEAGQFYQYAQTIVLSPEESMTYDLFKVTFFARIFFSNEQRQYQWRTRFAAAFPHVSQLITDFKSENYKDLPQKLSHLESEIMLHCITPRLFAEGIMEQFSLHDSFFCTASNKVHIEQIVVEEFQRYGVTPHLKNKTTPTTVAVVGLSVQYEPEEPTSKPVVPVIDLLDNYQAPHAATATPTAIDGWAEEVLRRLTVHEQELSRVSAKDFFV